MFCDLVGSTSLSGRLDPELYRGLISRYHKLAADDRRRSSRRFRAGSKGDGILALFGYPTVHGNDTERGRDRRLGDCRRGARRSPIRSPHTIGEPLAVRAALAPRPAVRRPRENDVYGLAANVAARLQELAEPGQVVVSDEVRTLVADRFDMEAGAAQLVKGVDSPLQPFTVIGRKSSQPTRSIRAPLGWARSRTRSSLREHVGSRSTRTPRRSLQPTIVGEAGIGKSRLLAAITDEVEIGGRDRGHAGGVAGPPRGRIPPIAATDRDAVRHRRRVDGAPNAWPAWSRIWTRLGSPPRTRCR